MKTKARKRAEAPPVGKNPAGPFYRREKEADSIFDSSRGADRERQTEGEKSRKGGGGSEGKEGLTTL